MPGLQRALALGSLLAGAALATAPARAHINLLEPVARVPGVPDSMLSLGPCGQRDNERLDERASVFRPGQSIDLVWDVYVQHVSYFRIAFDAEGDDSFSTRRSAPSDPSTDDPTQLPPGDGELILDYILDRTGEVERVERRVTLPDVECDRCTLQVTQFTYGLPLNRATYYQCADLVLDAGEEGASAAGAVGAASAGPALGTGDPDAADDASGCSLASASPGRSPGSKSAAGLEGLGLLLVALALGARAGVTAARRRAGAQGAGSDSIHSRSSAT